MSEGNKKRVVVVGGGFGGLEFCKTFRHEDAEIILVDRQNHHLFQPLLYQVATAGLSQPEIAQPIRSIFTERKDITVLMDEAVSIDLAARKILCKQQTLEYDHLIIGLGVVTSYSGQKPKKPAVAGGRRTRSSGRSKRTRLMPDFVRAIWRLSNWS